jgi:hypothetical protein
MASKVVSVFPFPFSTRLLFSLPLLFHGPRFYLCCQLAIVFFPCICFVNLLLLGFTILYYQLWIQRPSYSAVRVNPFALLKILNSTSKGNKKRRASVIPKNASWVLASGPRFSRKFVLGIIQYAPFQALPGAIFKWYRLFRLFVSY